MDYNWEMDFNWEIDSKWELNCIWEMDNKSTTDEWTTYMYKMEILDRFHLTNGTSKLSILIGQNICHFLSFGLLQIS